MATIDASIPLGIRPPQIDSPANALAKVLQVQEMQQGQQMNRLKMDEYQRSIQEQQELRSALSAPGADPYSVLTQRGRLKEAADWQKGKADVGKTEAETKYKQIETAQKTSELLGQGFGWLRQNPTPQNAAQLIEHFVSIGAIQPDRAQAAMQRIQADPSPQNIANVATMGFQAALQVKEQLAKIQTNNIGGSTVTQAIDPVTNRASTVSSIQNTQSPDNAASVAATIRGQNMTDARQRELGEIQRNAARTEVKETAEGFVLVDKGTGQVTKLQGISPKLKDAPPGVQTAVLTNAQNLARAERALKLVTGEDIGDPKNGGQKGDKEATGLKGYLPNQVLNRVDPQGVDARAAIADLGSLVIHDRSGAAVTAAEFPRLAPFIPTEKDDAATVKKKLQRFVQIYKEEMGAMQNAYNPSTGYRTPGGNAAPAAGQVLRFDANGNPVN